MSDPGWKEEGVWTDSDDLEAKRPPYIHAALAGGFGGLMGDMLMHSLDTVKTRQQGDPHIPPKYTNMASTYKTILKQEGIRKGLYGGVIPAALGSFSGTVLFFGTYEWSKRWMIDYGINPSISYFVAGLAADLAAAPLYVPTEVIKTRLQLQGRYNNPFFYSGYNYKSTLNACKTIIKTEGIIELFSGFKATLARDLPFSALQFAFYEQEQKLARGWMESKDIGLPLEILTGASAGGMAGILTCPLDVVKTRIQTQLDPSMDILLPHNKSKQTSKNNTNIIPSNNPQIKIINRTMSTHSPSTSLKPHGSLILDTESVWAGLRIIYKAEGIRGLLRGVGPRAVWTSIQSGTMLVMYQTLLKWFESHPIIQQ